jgi:hypothetical protein
MDAQVETAPHVRPGSMWEVVAISIAWPLGLGRFGAGLVTQQPFDGLQGLAFFSIVVFTRWSASINSVRSTRSWGD